MPYTLSVPQFPYIKMQIFLPISERVWSSGLTTESRHPNSQTEYGINFCCGFEATTLTCPRGQLPLENIEWPNPRLPGRICVLLFKWVVFLAGWELSLTLQWDRLPGVQKKRWSELRPAKLLGPALTSRPRWPPLWVLVPRPPSRAGLTLAQPLWS